MSKFYEALGLLKEATAEEIKAAYRKLAQMHHPDKGGNSDRFQEVQTAYDTLSNPDRRADYDRSGQGSPDKPPLRDLAIAEFALMINTLMNNPQLDFSKSSIVTYMGQLATSKLNHIQIQREQVEAKIAREESARDRVSVEKGDNLVAMVLDGMIRNDNHALSQMQAAEEVLAEVLRILDDHKYRLDEDPLTTTSTPWATFFIKSN